MRGWIIIAILAGVLTLGAGGVAVYMQTRGLRNNNPGNIRRIKGVQWQGQAVDQPDPDFISFIDAFHGIRALARTLKTYREKYGLDTVQGIITRWAPPTENDTVSYIKTVSNRLQVMPHEKLPLHRYPELVTAIIRHENGLQPYDKTLIENATKAGLS